MNAKRDRRQPWSEFLSNSVGTLFGADRVESDRRQIEHIARMLAAIDGLTPSNYPLVEDDMVRASDDSAVGR